MDPIADDIEARVIAVIAAALDCEPARVELRTSLNDIGAESLDFLDIVFRLEKEFHVRMPRLNVLQRAEDHFGAGALVADGVLTPLGVRLLHATMPEVPQASVAPGLRAREVASLFSPATFVRIVRRMLAATRNVLAACPGCGGSLQPSATTFEAACLGCGKIVPFPAGDEVLLQDLIACGS
jgi:acyl carrier protein